MNSADTAANLAWEDRLNTGSRPLRPLNGPPAIDEDGLEFTG